MAATPGMLRDRLVRWLVVSTGLVVILAHVAVSWLWAVAILLVGTAMVIWTQRRTPGLWLPVALALAVRSAVAAAHWSGVSLPDDDGDALVFDDRAWALAQEPLSVPPAGSQAYTWILSILYRVTGHEIMASEALNVVVGTAMVWGTALLARELWGTRAGTAAGVAAALFPALVLYSVVLLREAFVVAGMVWGVFAFVRWWRAPSVGWAMLTAGFWMLPFMMQAGLQFTAPAVLLLGVARLGPLRLQRKSARVVAAAVFIPAYLLLILLTASSLIWPAGGLSSPVAPGEGIEWDQGTQGNGSEPPGQNNGGGPSDPVAGVAKQQDDALRGRTAYPDWMHIGSWWEAIHLGPIRLVMLLFAPFPWMATQWRDLMGVGDSLLYMGMAWGLWRTRRHWLETKGFVVLVIAAVGISIFALGTSNYGTSIRHRAKFAPLLLACLGPAAWQWRIPGRPAGTNLASDLAAVQRRLNTAFQAP